MGREVARPDLSDNMRSEAGGRLSLNLHNEMKDVFTCYSRRTLRSS